jgi:hypothetical protein
MFWLKRRRRKKLRSNWRRCTACRAGMLSVFNIHTEQWERDWCAVCDGAGMLRV